MHARCPFSAASQCTLTIVAHFELCADILYSQLSLSLVLRGVLLKSAQQLCGCARAGSLFPSIFTPGTPALREIPANTSFEYLIYACQRTFLFLHIIRQKGDQQALMTSRPKRRCCASSTTKSWPLIRELTGASKPRPRPRSALLSEQSGLQQPGRFPVPSSQAKPRRDPSRRHPFCAVSPRPRLGCAFREQRGAGSYWAGDVAVLIAGAVAPLRSRLRRPLHPGRYASAEAGPAFLISKSEKEDGARSGFSITAAICICHQLPYHFSVLHHWARCLACDARGDAASHREGPSTGACSISGSKYSP